MAKEAHLDTRTENHQGGLKSALGASASSTDSGKKGSHGDGVSDVLQSTTSSPSSSSVVQVGTLPLLDQWRNITSSRFVLNVVKGHYLQLRCHPPLFCNFKWFNIKAALVHHPIFQKPDELLATGAIEPSTGGAGFYPNVFVVPKHIDGL